ncbi:MAG: hypothetical protein RJA22_850 [Verrucomicrobiota bacterium]
MVHAVPGINALEPAMKRLPLPSLTATLALLLLGIAGSPGQVLLDTWRADSLGLNDGDFVTTWTSTNGRVANPVSGTGNAILKRNVTPAGGSAVRFNRNLLTVGSSPVGGRTSFSIAYVFRPDAVGVSASGNNWYGKTGIVDAEQPGVTADWGTVLTETGNVGLGIGGTDTSTYSTGASLVDSNYHIACFTWGGGQQAVYVDNRAPVSATSPTAARNAAGVAFGGIATDEAAPTRRFVGDLVEIRFYDSALTAVQASNVIADLRNTHIDANVPRILSFTAATNFLYLGQSTTLNWQTTNATEVRLDNGIGAVAASGNRVVNPTVTTTYTLTTTNATAVRTAQLTLTVDPGVPVAANLSTNTPYNTPVAVTLRGTDPQGSNLTYAVVTPPAHGTLTGTPPSLTYTPAPNYAGLDSFTYQVNDGSFDSAPGTVSIQVVPPPTPPTGIVLSTTNLPAGAAPGAFLAALQALDVNEGDTHTFSLVAGFGDNGRFQVSGSTLLAGPTFAGGPGSTFAIRLRATDSASLSRDQDFTLRVVLAPPGVVINEIHYNSPDNTVKEEFIELHNPTGGTIDLSYWRLRGGVDFFFPLQASLPPGGYVVVGEHPATLAARYGVTAFGPWEGGLRNSGEEVTLRNALDEVVDRVGFRAEFPWPIAADGDGASLQLVHPSLDNDLGSSWRPGTPPTPGARNGVYATNAAPHIRQVDHTPKTPRSTNGVVITAKVTDPQGVASVVLHHQVVAPGNYIPATLPLTAAQLNNLNTTPLTNPPNPAFEAATNWAALAMNDAGANGDAVAGDGVYSVTLPPQANRTLVRYRITCTDTLGAGRRAPFEDDPSLNFAYYVYNGVPDYLGFSGASLQTLPVFTLITRDADINQCGAWFNTGDQLPQGVASGRNLGRLFFNWEGAMVYDGEVYDHIHYRLRGANGRYHPGKRSLRYRFNPGRYLDAKDQFGQRFPTPWRELTSGKGQGNRGSVTFALNEVVSYYLWNKVGVPAPRTLHFHLRVVRGAQEAGTNQYSGDFWGLSWAQEKYDANFLESHDLPKGNLYKLVDNYVLGVDERRYQGPDAVTNAADFFNLENNLTGFQSTEWLLAHANYTNWYRYFTVAEAIRHYDTWPSANKNGAWYFEPPYGASNGFFGRAMQLPYDSTDTWGPTWNNGEDILFNGIFASGATGGDAGQNPGLQLEYRNVVRELRELLFQQDQIYSIIDAFAGPLHTVAAADFQRWAAAPAPGNYGSVGTAGGQSPGPANTQGFPAYIQDMKNFMFVGGNNAWWLDRQAIAAGGWIGRLDTVAADADIPTRPVLTYAGAPGFPADGLVFQSSAFADPQGAGTFAAIQWRVAEVLPTNTVVTNVAQLRLEYDAAWQSAELPAFNATAAVPAGLLQPERLYRARVRHKDNTGRWSRWSAPVEFRPRAGDLLALLRRDLVFNEVNYNPPPDGLIDGDEFEFIELQNTGTNTLDLTGLYFSDGVDFAFTNGTRLPPGGLFLLAANPAALAARHPGVVVHGIYSGRLNNNGERLAVAHPVAGVVASLEFGDRAPWPVAADGFGFSLVRDPATGGYRASAVPGGSPGADGGLSALGGVVVNEVLSSSTPPLVDFIELRSLAATNLDLGGWYLTDDPQAPFKHRLAAGTILPAGGYLVLDEGQFNPTPGLGVSFSLSSLGDEVYLFSSGAPGTLSGYSHGFAFGGAPDGVSFGRHLNSVGEEQFPLQAVRTPGAANAGPRLGPVVISEIHYNPRAATDEFVEIRNVAATAVPLSDPGAPANTWRLAGLNFSFPPGVSLPPGGWALVVAGEPTAFRARWGVPAAVPIFQYSGADLQDSGENLELQAPDRPDTNGTPYHAVEAVRYNDRRPWPLAADGAGASLQRREPIAYGDDPAAWFGAAPTPGAGPAAGTAPVITSQPSPALRTNAIGGSTTFSAGATGSPLLQYQWSFNGGLLPNATNASLTLENVQLEAAGDYSLVVYNGAGSAESSNATLVVRAGASVTQQPTNVAVLVPPDPAASPTNRASFTVGAVSFNPPLRYQWLFNGLAIPGATNATYSFTNVQFADGGTYRAAVADGVAETLSAPATLTPVIRPRVVEGPFGPQTNVINGTVTLGVTVTGYPPPFVFRWLSNSLSLRTNLVAGPTDFMTFNAPTGVPASFVRYRVEVTNFFGVSIVDGVNRIFFTNYFLADADLDGLPDSYEAAYGGGALNPLEDADQDGASNLAEYLAGTDPTNAQSFLAVGEPAVLPGTGVTLQVGAVANRSYSVFHSPSPTGGPAVKLADILPKSFSRVETVSDPTWTSNRFYRIVTPRQP